MAAAHTFELPNEAHQGQLAAAVQAAEDGQVVTLTRHGLPVVVLQSIDPDQAWYWTEEWQASEQEAVAEIDSGDIVRSTSIEDFLADLDSQIEELNRREAREKQGKNV